MAGLVAGAAKLRTLTRPLPLVSQAPSSSALRLSPTAVLAVASHDDVRVCPCWLLAGDALVPLAGLGGRRRLTSFAASRPLDDGSRPAASGDGEFGAKTRRFSLFGCLQR